MPPVFDAEDILATASSRTDLTDFGPEDFREPFGIFVDDLNQAAAIAPARADKLHERLQRLLCNRLFLQRDLALHPEILDQDLGTPIFISTLPRTGSTKLHRMLSASQDFETTKMWQTHMPSCIPDQPDSGKAERIAATGEYERWMYETSPGVLSGHPMFTMEAEEDQWLLEQSFRYPIFAGMYNAPGYWRWLQQADMAPCFDYFKTLLQYFQWQSGGRAGRPWLLKSPTHFGYEPFLQHVFEKIKVIVTHRDPAKCIPSITAASVAMRKLYSDADTGAATAADLAPMFSYAATAHMAWRDANPNAEILDIAFREVSQDGLKAAQQVYDFLDMPLSEPAGARMRSWEANEGHEQHVKGVYSAAAFGTTEAALHEVFAPYMTRFSAYI